jgi:hypothetical protein
MSEVDIALTEACERILAHEGPPITAEQLSQATGYDVAVCQDWLEQNEDI